MEEQPFPDVLNDMGRGTVGTVCGGVAVVRHRTDRAEYMDIDITYWLLKLLDTPNDDCSSGCLATNCCGNIAAECHCIMTGGTGRIARVISTGTMGSLKQRMNANPDKYACTLQVPPASKYPICGNGFVEEGETCDCTAYEVLPVQHGGFDQRESIPQCSAACSKNCGSKVATKDCPSLNDTTTICRQRDEDEACDIAETCIDGACPPNGYSPDGTSCGGGGSDGTEEKFCEAGKCKNTTAASEGDDSGSTWWIYVLIVIAALVVILIIVVVIFAAKRRKASSTSSSVSGVSKKSPLEPYTLSGGQGLSMSRPPATKPRDTGSSPSSKRSSSGRSGNKSGIRNGSRK